MNTQEYYCQQDGCGQRMDEKWPAIAHLLRCCPDCAKKKNGGKKLEYRMFGKNKKLGA